jgi:hypothetical protein
LKWFALPRPAVIYDATNCIALLLIGGGVGMFSVGAACITVGALVMGLNLATAKWSRGD